MFMVLYNLIRKLLKSDEEILNRLQVIERQLAHLFQQNQDQDEVLARILAAVEPLPAVGFTFTVESEGQITLGATQYDMTNSQQLTATIQPVDKKGNPAAIDGVPVWASSDETIITVVPASDGLSAVVAAVGPLGSAKVSVTGDADLGPGVSSIFGTLDVTITQGQAVGFKITAGEPTEQGPSTPPPTP